MKDTTPKKFPVFCPPPKNPDVFYRPKKIPLGQNFRPKRGRQIYTVHVYFFCTCVQVLSEIYWPEEKSVAIGPGLVSTSDHPKMCFLKNAIYFINTYIKINLKSSIYRKYQPLGLVHFNLAITRSLQQGLI